MSCPQSRGFHLVPGEPHDPLLEEGGADAQRSLEGNSSLASRFGQLVEDGSRKLAQLLTNDRVLKIGIAVTVVLYYVDIATDLKSNFMFVEDGEFAYMVANVLAIALNIFIASFDSENDFAKYSILAPGLILINALNVIRSSASREPVPKEHIIEYQCGADMDEALQNFKAALEERGLRFSQLDEFETTEIILSTGEVFSFQDSQFDDGYPPEATQRVFAITDMYMYSQIKMGDMVRTTVDVESPTEPPLTIPKDAEGTVDIIDPGSGAFLIDWHGIEKAWISIYDVKTMLLIRQVWDDEDIKQSYKEVVLPLRSLQTQLQHFTKNEALIEGSISSLVQLYALLQFLQVQHEGQMSLIVSIVSGILSMILGLASFEKKGRIHHTAGSGMAYVFGASHGTISETVSVMTFRFIEVVSRLIVLSSLQLVASATSTSSLSCFAMPAAVASSSLILLILGQCQRPRTQAHVLQSFSAIVVFPAPVLVPPLAKTAATCSLVHYTARSLETFGTLLYITWLCDYDLAQLQQVLGRDMLYATVGAAFTFVASVAILMAALACRDHSLLLKLLANELFKRAVAKPDDETAAVLEACGLPMPRQDAVEDEVDDTKARPTQEILDVSASPVYPNYTEEQNKETLNRVMETMDKASSDIEAFYFRGCDFSLGQLYDMEVPAVAERLPRFTALKHVTLDDNSTLGAAHYSQLLPACPAGLEGLGVTKSILDDASVEVLAEQLPRFKALKKLRVDFIESRVRAGTKAGLLKGCADCLEEFSLKCDIDDEFAGHMAELLPRFTVLKKMDMRDCSGLGGGQTIKVAKGLASIKTLRHLDVCVKGTIPVEAWREFHFTLRASLPDLQIEWPQALDVSSSDDFGPPAGSEFQACDILKISASEHATLLDGDLGWVKTARISSLVINSYDGYPCGDRHKQTVVSSCPRSLESFVISHLDDTCIAFYAEQLERFRVLKQATFRGSGALSAEVGWPLLLQSCADSLEEIDIKDSCLDEKRAKAVAEQLQRFTVLKKVNFSGISLYSDKLSAASWNVLLKSLPASVEDLILSNNMSSLTEDIFLAIGGSFRCMKALKKLEFIQVVLSAKSLTAVLCNTDATIKSDLIIDNRLPCDNEGLMDMISRKMVEERNPDVWKTLQDEYAAAAGTTQFN